MHPDFVWIQREYSEFNIGKKVLMVFLGSCHVVVGIDYSLVIKNRYFVPIDCQVDSGVYPTPVIIQIIIASAIGAPHTAEPRINPRTRYRHLLHGKRMDPVYGKRPDFIDMVKRITAHQGTLLPG